MKNELDYSFRLRLIDKSSDPDFILALKIYNETTPYEIKTNTNEIVFWLDQNRNDNFEPMFFVLYFSNRISGFAMMTYIRSQRIVILEYLALESQYRVNSVFFTYINLLESYLNINQYDVAFILNEVSNRRDGTDIDKESQLFSKLLCVEGYGKINAPYYTPPLGNNNFESTFEAFLYAKSAGDIHGLKKETYLEIVKSIYFDYYMLWYQFVMSENELTQYRSELDKAFHSISQQTKANDMILVTYIECPALFNNRNNVKTNGLPPAGTPKPKVLLHILLLALIILGPIAIVWGYRTVLNWLQIPMDSASDIIGSCLGAGLTVAATIWVAKRKNL